MAVRAIRGATTAKNTKEDIFEATKELIKEIVKRNNLNSDDMIDIIFTMTKDLNAGYPAAAVRETGLTDVPLFDVCEPEIKGALEKCIRVMIHINTDKKNCDMSHVYLREAVKLRPDLARKK